MLAASIIISILITVLGLIKVNLDNNYETIWGAMIFFGAVATLILSLVSISLFIVALI